MDIEALAVNKISDMISRCSHLKAYIATNDKTPFTDGHIDLYSGLRQVKAEWLGRVSVQVKGRTQKIARGSVPAHQIARTDLLAYQKDSGVLYFYVAIDPKSKRRKPYFALLSPFEIDNYLRSAPEDYKRISIKLAEFPDDPSSIQGILALALKTRDQNPSLGFDPILFERLKSFTVHTTSDLDLHRPITLRPGSIDYALVLHTTDGMSIPLGGELQILPPDYVQTSINVRILSGQVAYEGATKKRIDDRSVEVRISEGLRLFVQNGPDGLFTRISLTLENSLSGRLKSVAFYIALLDSGLIQFNEESIPFDVSESPADKELRNILRSLRELANLFDYLGVDMDLIDLSQVDEEHWRQLHVLHRALVLGEEVADESAETSRVLQAVGPWKLMFLLVPGSDARKWQVINPFSVETRHQFRWAADGNREQERIPVTAYDIVEQEHLGTVLNMQLEAIVGAYEAIADLKSTHNLANHRVLNLIMAADDSELRAAELLKAASDLNDWLISEQGDEPHHLINRWQIQSRRGELSTEQRSEIRKLKRRMALSDVRNADQLEVSCALLLGDKEEVDDLIRQLSEERLQQLREWPIWRHHKA